MTEHFTTDGSLTENDLGVEPKWSRSSLMTFVFIEIINHILCQINSHNFRMENEAFIGSVRKLRRIVITCPTGMTQQEQIKLRECAKFALKALASYHKKVQDQDIGQMGDLDFEGINISLDDIDDSLVEELSHINDGPFSKIEIVPDPKDISVPTPQLENSSNKGKDWIFDEASASQIVYIYGQVANKYSSNFRQFFDIYGKAESTEVTSKKSLTIASVDIGGGTTDFMICNYSYSEKSQSAVLTPNPLYWETFSLAGDDLLKEVVHQILIDGHGKQQGGAFNTKGGIIRNSAIENGCKDVTDKILHFFGQQANYQGASHIVYRKNFVTQVLIPIAQKILEHVAKEKASAMSYNYDQIFQENPPNDKLINYINNHFGNGFNFKSIIWETTADEVNHIIRYKFKDIIQQLAGLSFAHKVDILLLAGKPVSLLEFRNLFVREMPLSPDRIISLSNFRIGTWYPYTDKKGHIVDPKTTVAVGGMIYALAGLDKQIQGFELNTKLLREKLRSTADYIGEFDKGNSRLSQVFLNKVKDSHLIEKRTLPLLLGFKQLPHDSYLARPIYKLDFNLEYIRNKIKGSQPTLSEADLNEGAFKELARIRNQGPFTIEISRDIEVSKERLSIDSIENNLGRPVDKSSVKLILMTLEDENGYWLDSGVFPILRLKN